MPRRKNREWVWDAFLPLVALAVGLVLAAGQLTARGRAIGEAVGQFFLLVLIVAAGGGVLVMGRWWLRRGRARRSAVPVAFLPRARVVDFPPQVEALADLNEPSPFGGGLGSLPPGPPPSLPDGPDGAAEPTTQELVNRLREVAGFQFEKVTATVYECLGYRVSRRGRTHPEEGIDLVLEKQGQTTGVLCQRWNAGRAGVKDIREFLGALTHARIGAGIFVTLEGYTNDARELAAAHQIKILTGTGLVELLDQGGGRFDPAIIAALNDFRKE